MNVRRLNMRSTTSQPGRTGGPYQGLRLLATAGLVVLLFAYRSVPRAEATLIERAGV